MHVLLIPGLFALVGIGGIAADCALDGMVCADEDSAEVDVPVQAMALEERCVASACVSAQESIQVSVERMEREQIQHARLISIDDSIKVGGLVEVGGDRGLIALF